MKKESKNIRYTIRFTKSENEIIKKKWNKHKDQYPNLMPFLRDLILSKKILKINDLAFQKIFKNLDTIVKTKTELNKIGTNINQIAKKINTDNKFDEKNMMNVLIN